LFVIRITFNNKPLVFELLTISNQNMSDVIIIRNGAITDSIFDVKIALEESTICRRVRKIFAARCNDDPDEHPINSNPNKKVFYIWVEWGTTNASHMFTASLRHHREEAILFKLDLYSQPIVTDRDEFGNATERAHWIVRPSSRFMMQEDEMYYLGLRTNEEVWQMYLAEGETAEDTDEEEEEEQATDVKDDEEVYDEPQILE